METNHKYRTAYIRLNKQEEDEHTQENLILSKNRKINEFVFESPSENRVKLKELLNNIKSGEAGRLKRIDFEEASGLTKQQLGTCIKFQKAGVFN
jgi:hypothetical protein